MRTPLLVVTTWIALVLVAYAQDLLPPSNETPQVLNQPPALPPGPPPLGANPPLIYEQPPATFTDSAVLPRRTIGGRPGWSFDLDLALLFPNVRWQSEGSGMFSDSADFGLNPGIAGTLTVGYIFERPHALFFSYRGFDARGYPDSDFANEELKTGMELNDFDWVYQRRFGSDFSRLRFAGEIGIRLTSLSYSYSIHSHFPSIFDSEQLIHATSTWCNEFVGAGPTVGVSDELILGPGLSLFSRADFGALFGEQTVRTKYRTRLPWVDSTSSSIPNRDNNDVQVLRAMAGMNWMPQNTPRMSFQFGYQFEYWWRVGRFDDGSDDFMLNGLFGRMRFTF